MEEYVTLDQVDRIVETIRSWSSRQPEVGVILGSGLGTLAEAVEEAVIVPVQELPGWPTSTVEGHQGRLVMGRLEGREVLVLQGRVHFYEGYNMSLVTLPVRVMRRLGIGTVIVTNAAGAVHPDFNPGDLMLITDHLNLIGMAGNSPLRGPNIDEFGPRFPDMSQAYHPGLLALARRTAKEQGLTLREGVYVCLAGPSFETPADLRFLRLIGADAVGMSTVPEVTVAHHAGMRVMGVSGISNKANLDGSTITTHQEVLEAGQVIVPKLTGLLRGVLREL